MGESDPEKSRNEEAFNAAEELLKDLLRDQSVLPFHCPKITDHYDPGRIKRILGLEEMGVDEVKRVFALAGDRAAAVVPGLKFQASGFNGEEISHLELNLEGKAEWADALRYAHGTGDAGASKILSPPADELLSRIQSGELTEKFVSEQSVRSRIRLFGYFSDFDRIIAEIRLKKTLEILLEHQGDRYHKRRHAMRFSVRPAPVPKEPAPGMNPVLILAPGSTPRDFARWLKEYLIASDLAGNQTRTLWRIGSRAEFFRCFPSLSTDGRIKNDPLIELLTGGREDRLFDMAWSFSREALEWTVEVRPRVSWEETRAGLRADLTRPTPEVEFGLSPQAAGLYEWIRALDFGALEFGLSPSVEKAVREKRFPLTEGLQRNLRTVIDLLCEEITERTSYQLRVVEWLEGYHDKATRIRIRHRQSGEI